MVGPQAGRVRSDEARLFVCAAGGNAGTNAGGGGPQRPDYFRWHALHTWLELAGRREVTIPYARKLASLAEARAMRRRRNFGAVLNLIRAHAILQQAAWQRDPHGRIIATLADYAVVHDLVIDIITQGVQATVDARTRETVAAVKELDTPKDPGVKVAAAARAGSVPISVENVCGICAVDRPAINRPGYMGNAP